MRLVHLSIRNFKGIASLEWSPPLGVTCLVGAGDSGKTSILEAIELVLLPRPWVQFVDSDFFGANVSNAINIEATVIEVPSRLLIDEKFGLAMRGWTDRGGVHDEPEDDEEVALTIRLHVDEGLEPTWHVVRDDDQDGRGISARDREALGVLRLGEDIDRHLSWSRGSALAHVTGDPEAVNTALTKAHRSIRDSVAGATFDDLADVATQAGQWGDRYGATLALPLSVSIDPRQLNIGSGALGLRQQSGVPARSVGLGSRRLLALAIQRQSGSQTLTLVDEIEYGLEPHRLRHLLRELQRSQAQVLLTSHSETTVAELGPVNLAVVRRDSVSAVSVLIPGETLRRTRKTPEAFLARRVIVCEGKTEWGMSLSLVDHWDSLEGTSLASIGTVFVEGGGSEGTSLAQEFNALGFQVIYWGDDDNPSLKPSINDLKAIGIPCIIWADEICVEKRIMFDVPEVSLEALWNLAVEEKGLQTVCNHLATGFGVDPRPQSWAEWCRTFDIQNLRQAMGEVSAKSGWYKSIDGGRRLGELICKVLQEVPDSDLATKLNLLKTLAYDH